MSWSSSSPSSPRGCSPNLNHSNLESFIHTVTPIVPRRSFPQSDVNNNGTVDYFYLSDLWESCYEWSAYGVGSPIVLSNGEKILQYYTPYLSALQLFTAKPSSTTSSVNNYRVELEVESSSDDMESDKLSRLSNESSKTWNGSGDSNTDHHHSSMSRMDCCADLYFESYETCPPYLRVPLTEQVVGFSQKRPGIMSFKSTDLSPASWVAFAWYPIYHIPFKQTMKDMSACFLTFHTLSSSFQEILKVNEDQKEKGQCSKISRGSGRDKILLPPFALATYKLQGEVWMSPFTADEERLHDLHCAADSWLKQLNVQHHDFSFFAHHSNIGIRRE